MNGAQDYFTFEFNATALLAVAACLLILSLVGLTRRGSTFLTADRSVAPVIGGMATSAAFLSAAPFLGLAGLLFSLGSDGLSWIVGIGAGFVLMAVLIAPQLRASGALTVPEFLAQRFGGRLVPLIATFIVLGCSVPLLVAQFVAIGTLADHALNVPAGLAVGGAALLIAVSLAAGGMRNTTWIGALLLVAILMAYLAPLGLLAWAKYGNPFGPLAYGHALEQLQTLEIDMISEGLADPISLKPHLRPFLQVDLSNTLALIICLMAGTAVLPHVLMRSAVTTGVRQTRSSMAWALLFTAGVLAAIPAYAAMTKHEVYSFIAKGAPFAQLPEVFARDDVSVHGVPFSLYHGVINAVRAGAGDGTAVGAQLQQAGSPDLAAWSLLKPQVKGALVEAARGAADATYAQRFETWRTTILPVAATSAGNKTGKLTQSAVTIEPDTAVIFGFQLAGLSREWIALFAIGGILAALATAMATAWAVAMALTRDLGISLGRAAVQARGEVASTIATRVAAVGIAAAAAGLALHAPADWPRLAVWTFSIAAAGLFPALVLGIWWKRATAAGAIAGMVAGLLLTIGYTGGSHFAPVTFFEATGRLSDAGAMAAKKVADLKSIAEKASPETKVAAEAQLLGYVQGSAFKAGAANWLGIHNTAAAVFGLPLGFFLIILVSLLTRRPSDETLQFVEGIRRPPVAQSD